MRSSRLLRFSATPDPGCDGCSHARYSCRCRARTGLPGDVPRRGNGGHRRLLWCRRIDRGTGVRRGRPFQGGSARTGWPGVLPVPQLGDRGLHESRRRLRDLCRRVSRQGPARDGQRRRHADDPRPRNRPCLLYGEDGKAIARNPGQVRYELLVDHGGTPNDPSDDVELGSTDVKESTGRSDDFCEAMVAALS